MNDCSRRTAHFRFQNTGHFLISQVYPKKIGIT